MTYWTCDSCDRDFNSERALDQHLENSYAHNYCFKCCKDFTTPNALEIHLNTSSAHRGKSYFCDECDEYFESQNSLNMHFERSPNHRDEDEYWCQKCQRSFNTENDLDMHIERSAAHIQDQYRPNSMILRNNYDPNPIKCPGCTRYFATTSAMTIHLESSTCASGVTRQSLNRFVHAQDRHGLITKNLLTSSETILSTQATDAAWNGRAFECYFCDREFRDLRALNQHLNSPAHEQHLYHCPKCRTEFKLFSGLVQHVESERCGLMRFRDVRGHFQGSIRFDRMLSY